MALANMFFLGIGRARERLLTATGKLLFRPRHTKGFPLRLGGAFSSCSLVLPMPVADTFSRGMGMRAHGGARGTRGLLFKIYRWLISRWLIRRCPKGNMMLAPHV